MVAIGGVAFAVGRTHGPDRRGDRTASGSATAGPSRRQLRPDRRRAHWVAQRCAASSAAGGLTVEGTVQSVDGDTLTITTANGQTVEVIARLGHPRTTQQAAGSASDVTTGSKVSVQLDARRARDRAATANAAAPTATAAGPTGDGISDVDRHPVTEGVG